MLITQMLFDSQFVGLDCNRKIVKTVLCSFQAHAVTHDKLSSNFSTTFCPKLHFLKQHRCYYFFWTSALYLQGSAQKGPTSSSALHWNIGDFEHLFQATAAEKFPKIFNSSQHHIEIVRVGNLLDDVQGKCDKHFNSWLCHL